MPLLEAKIREQIAAQLKELKEPVTLHVFTQEMECQFCRETRQLCLEVAEASRGKVKTEVHNFTLDKETVERYGIDQIPAIAVAGRDDPGIRFFGIPGGYEFTSLLLAIKMVGSGESGLSDASRQKLGALTKPVQIKVYVTLTCPYCPSAVHTAHQMAMTSPHVTAAMIESAEFPHLANRDQVMGVPKTVVEGAGSFEGALPESDFVERTISLVTGGHA